MKGMDGIVSATNSAVPAPSPVARKMTTILVAGVPFFRRMVVFSAGHSLRVDADSNDLKNLLRTSMSWCGAWGERNRFCRPVVVRAFGDARGQEAAVYETAAQITQPVADKAFTSRASVVLGVRLPSQD